MNSSATTESEIVNMTLRMAAAANQAGFTEAETLALSASLSSIGVNAEAGGGSMSRILNQINNDVLSGSGYLEKYASVAGVSSQEFQQAWGEDAAGAFDMFVQGLGRAGASGESMSAILIDMGIKETIATSAMMSLAGSGDLLSRSIDTANQGWQENTALTDEAAQRYETLESKIQIFKNQLTDVGITIKEGLDAPLRDVVNNLTETAEAIGNVFKSDKMQAQLTNMGAAFANIIPPITQLATSVIPVFVEILSSVFSVISSIASGALPPLAEALSTIANAVLPVLSRGFSQFAEIISESSGAFSGFLTSVATVVANLASAILPPLMAVFNGLATVITNLASALLPPLMAVINQLGTAFTALSPVIAAAVTAMLAFKAGMSVLNSITAVQTALQVYAVSQGAATAADAAAITKGALNGTLKATEIVVAALTGKISLNTIAEVASTKASALATAGRSALNTVTKIGATVMALLTGQTTLQAVATAIATKAQIAFNAAMNSNVFLLAITAIAAVAAGIYALVKAFNTVDDATQETIDRTDQLIESNKALLDSTANTTAEFTQSVGVLTTETAQYANLASAMYATAAAAENDASKRSQLAAQADYLNKVMGETVVSYDAERNALSLTEEELQKVIAAKQTLATYEAYQQHSADLLYQIAEAQTALNLVLQERADIEKRIAEETDMHGKDRGALRDQIKKLTESEGELTQQLSKLKDEQTLAAQSAYEYKEQVDELAEAEKKQQEAQQEALETTVESYNTVSERRAAYIESFGDDTKAVDAYLKDEQKAYDMWADVTSNAYDRVYKISDDTIESMHKNVKQNQEDTELFMKRMDEVRESGLVSEQVLAQLADGGMDSMNMLREIHKGITSDNADTVKKTVAFTDDLDKSNELAQQYAEEHALRMHGIIEDNEKVMRDGSIKVGEAIPEGEAQGIKNKASEPVNAVSNMQDDVVQAGRDGVEMNSPSKAFIRIGESIGAGLTNGINNGKSGALTAVMSLASSVIARAKSVLDIHSPSRVFAEIGLNIDKGWASGITAGGSLVQSAVAQVSKNGIAAVEEWLSEKDNKNKLSAAEEVKVWAAVAQKYAQGTTERAQADAESFAATQTWLKERQELIVMSAEEEAEVWLTVSKQYAECTTIRAKADQESYNALTAIIKERTDLYAVSAKEEMAMWTELANQYTVGTKQRSDADKQRISATKSYLDEMLSDEKMTAEQVVVYWGQTVNKYKEGTAARAQAEKEFTKVQQELFNQQKQNLLDSLNAQKTAALDAIKSRQSAELETIKTNNDALIASLKEQETATTNSIAQQKEVVLDGLKTQKEAVAEVAKANSEAIKNASNENIAQY